MVFSSLSFILLFLPIVLLIYYITPNKYKNIVILIFSLVFYYIGEQKLVLLMLFSSLIGYSSGILIKRYDRYKKIILILGVLINVLLLFYFKYFDFLITCLNDIFKLDYNLFDITLPIGISFYTFQSLSYIVDIYRGNKIEKSFINFLTYLCFFPQLIAGPIVRYEDIKDDLVNRKHSLKLFIYGIKRFIIGLSKKVLLANQLYELIDMYSNMNTHTVLFSWLIGVIVPLEIYLDFSGYSDMAIGLGKMFGFNFKENFNYPLKSRSATDFWRNWHISLGSWFRDYVYIPLGGNKVKTYKHIINILIVWFLTGLWHGAEYNFVLWGLYYGIILILEKYVYLKFLNKHSIISYIYSLFITIIGFKLFNATSLNMIKTSILELFGIYSSSFTNVVTNYYIRSYFLIILVSILLSIGIFKNITIKINNNKKLSYISNIFLIILFILCISYLVDGSYNPFLYFRF